MSKPLALAATVRALIASGFTLDQSVRLVSVGSGRSRSDVLFAFNLSN